jgi:hypothetical protein
MNSALLDSSIKVLSNVFSQHAQMLNKYMSICRDPYLSDGVKTAARKIWELSII